jgi:sugar phosphate isomerase/epimerase
VPDLAGDPDALRELLAEHKVQLVCLGSSVTLDSKKQSQRARQKATLIEFIELAEKIGCPNVRMFAGETQSWDNRRAALTRIAEALISLAPTLSRHGVTLLVENGGDLRDSEAIWYLIDAVSHPRVKCCWNQCSAKQIRERPTNSIPRLGNKIGLVHLTDAVLDEDGTLLEYRPLGQGDVEIARQMDLLTGIVYDRFVIVEWPRLWVPSLAPAEEILPAAAKFLRERINEKQAVLTAYKGDKNAPKFAARPAGAGFGSVTT